MKRTAIILALLGLGVLTVGVGCKPDKTGPAAAVPAAGAPDATPPVVEAISQLNLTPPGTPISDKAFVTAWAVFGPFKFKETDFGGDQQQASVDKAFVADEAGLNGTQAVPAGVAWKVMKFTGGEGEGQIDLDGIYDAADHATAYAVAWLDAPEEMKDLQIRFGSDDYAKIWINGKLVHTYKAERRSGEADTDTVPGISLRKGTNRVVVKCVDVVMGWNFYFRLTDAKGTPVHAIPHGK